MQDGNSARLAGATGLIASLAVAAPVVIDLVSGEGTLINGPQWLWWSLYVLFVLTLTIDVASDWAHGPSWQEHTLLAIEIAAAVGVFLVDPTYGWAGVLFVITAGSGAYAVNPIASTFQVAAQTALIALGQLWAGVGADSMLNAFLWGSFQAFAVLVVRSEKREAAARQELAASNVELRAAADLLSQSTQTAERLRIARELHDIVGHQLTALSLELEVASHRVDDAGRPHVLRARDTAKELLGDVRDAVGDLRSQGPELSERLRGMVDDLPGLAVTLDVVEDVVVSDEQATVILRCVQEIVTNTLRHASARRLWITVRTGRDGVVVTGRDDGKGTAELVAGNGLVGMRERVEGAGGELVLESAPGQGFTVAASLPA